MIIVEKPWGKEEIIEKNEHYVVKRIVMHKGARCSLQYHKIKRETIYTISGKLKVTYVNESGDQISETFVGNSFLTLPAGITHRMTALEEAVYLETSTPELDDVVRIDDDYVR